MIIEKKPDIYMSGNIYISYTKFIITFYTSYFYSRNNNVASPLSHKASNIFLVDHFCFCLKVFSYTTVSWFYPTSIYLPPYLYTKRREH